MQSSRSRCTQKASERATIRKSGLVRAATAARMRSAASSTGWSFCGKSVCLPAPVWSSMWIAATPAASKARTVISRAVEARLGVGDDRQRTARGDRPRLRDELVER